MVCTFFGHRDCSDSVYDCIKSAIIHLITNEGVNSFIVGNNGNFDRLVIRVLKECTEIYTHIEYCVALAYMPKNEVYEFPTVFMQGLESVPKKYAISYRNKMMIDKCDWVIGYIRRGFGGAHNFFELARKKDKKYINLYKTQGGAP